MTWTHDAPTKPGWYWWREDVDGCPMPGEVQKSVIEADRLWVHFEEISIIAWPFIEEIQKEFPSCQWSSTPIPEPKEAE